MAADTRRQVMTTAPYREIKSYTEAKDDGPRVVLASEDGKPTILHVMVVTKSLSEVISTVNDTVGGKALADAIGEAADKAILYAVVYGD